MNFLSKLFGKKQRLPQPNSVSQIDQATVEFSLCNNTLLRHEGKKGITAVAISNDSALVVSATQDGELMIWDRSQGKLRKQVKASISTRCVSFTPDNRTLWVGGGDGNDGLIELIDLNSGKNLSIIKSHNRPVMSIAFSRDGKLAASTGISWKVIAWGLPSGKVELVGEHPDIGKSVTFTPDASRLISISRDWTIKVWDMKSRSCIATWEGEPDLYGVALSSDGRWALVGNKDKGRKIIDVTTGKAIASWGTSWGFTSWANALYASPNGSLVVWEGVENLLKCWHVQTGKYIAVLDKHAAEVSVIAVSLDGTCVVSGAKDGTVGIWNAR